MKNIWCSFYLVLVIYIIVWCFGFKTEVGKASVMIAIIILYTGGCICDTRLKRKNDQ